MRKFLMAGALALGTATMTAPVAAQQSGLVNVDIGDVLSSNDVDIQDVLSRNNISANVNPIDQVPVGLAANVCGISVLAARNLTGPCDARADITQGQAQALARAIQRSQ